MRLLFSIIVFLVSISVVAMQPPYTTPENSLKKTRQFIQEGPYIFTGGKKENGEIVYSIFDREEGSEKEVSSQDFFTLFDLAKAGHSAQPTESEVFFAKPQR